MRVEHAGGERTVRPGHAGSGLAQWATVLAPLLAAFAQQQLAYGFVVWACTRDLHVLVHLPALVALGATATAAWSAWRALRRAGVRRPGDERSTTGRARFMAVLALAMCAFSGVLIVALWLPAAFIHPCTR